MKQKSHFIAGYVILLAALLGGTGCKEKAEERQPNFIIIFDIYLNILI